MKEQPEAAFREPTPNWSASPYQVHDWVMPLAFAIANGDSHEEAVNGICFSPLGDLLLYRKITDSDRIKRPTLVGISEVWIVFELGDIT